MAVAIKYTETRYALVHTGVKHKDPSMEPAAFMMSRDSNMLNGIVMKHARDTPKKQVETPTKQDTVKIDKGGPPPSDVTGLQRQDLLALNKQIQEQLGKTNPRKKGSPKKGGKGGKKKGG